MKLSRKQIALIALILVLMGGSIAFAILYMTKHVDISGGVSVVGAIEVYEEDGVTPFTSYDFPNFTGGSYETKTKYFFINNTGNQPLYVYWNISISSLNWTVSFDEYHYYVDDPNPDTLKYVFAILENWTSPIDHWYPNDSDTPEGLQLAVSEGKLLRIDHTYTGTPNTAETYTLTISFYAKDT